LPLAAVGELHLAGFTRDTDAGGAPLLIDSHGSPVDASVWGLFAGVVARLGALPTLLERDNDVPDLEVLLAEAQHAQSYLEAGGALHLEPRHGRELAP